MAKLKELQQIRNIVRHAGKLTSEQKDKLKVLSQDIIRKVLASEI